MHHFQLFYVSRASGALTASQVRVLVGEAQVLNRRAGIGGLLTFTGRHFAQILEGPETNVRALAQRISGDPRHADYRKILESHNPSKVYGGWDMQLIESPALDADIGELVCAAAGVDATDAAARVLARIRQEVQWRLAD